MGLTATPVDQQRNIGFARDVVLDVKSVNKDCREISAAQSAVLHVIEDIILGVVGQRADRIWRTGWLLRVHVELSTIN